METTQVVSVRAEPRIQPDAEGRRTRTTWPPKRGRVPLLVARLASRLPEWITRPDFLLVLAVGAALRLTFLGQTTFLGDQAELLALARSAAIHHSLPVTGIRSSIGTLNPPASIYILMPFALLGDPRWATLATALLNVVAVILLYFLADRYIGRRAAFAAGLLYASAGWPVYFSRYIWQQNLLAPVVLLFFWTICRGVLERRSGWLGWNVLLWGIAIQLHPSAAALLGVTVVAAMLAWRTLRPRDALWCVLALLVLFLPTVIWEHASGGSDVSLFGAYEQQPALYNADALGDLLSMLGPQGPLLYGAGTVYAKAYWVIAWLTGWLDVLFVASAVWVLAQLGGALRAAIRLRHLPGGNWRILLLLACWQFAPLVAMIKHPYPIHEHYLLAVLPAPYVMMGAFLQDVARRLPGVLARVSKRFPRLSVKPASGGFADIALVMAALVLGSAQTYGAAAQLATLDYGRFDGILNHSYSHYGITLESQRAALAFAHFAARTHEARVFVATTDLHQESMGYLVNSGYGPALVYDATTCLVVPSAGSLPAVVLGAQSLDSLSLLQQLPDVRLLDNIPVQGAPALPLYLVPAGAQLPREIPLNTSDASGMHVIGYSLAQSQGSGSGISMAIHWTGAPPAPPGATDQLDYWYGADPTGNSPAIARYIFTVQSVDRAGRPMGAPISNICPTLAWGSGEDVYSWLTLPGALTQQMAAHPVAGWQISVQRQLIAIARPHFGPLALETGDVYLAPPESFPGATTTIPIGGK